MRILVDAAVGEIPEAVASHQAAHAHLRAMQLRVKFKGSTVDVASSKTKPDWNDYDKIVLYHGMNFTGALNLPGGMSDSNVNKFKRIVDQKNRIWSLDTRLPDYGQILSKRKDHSIPEFYLKELSEMAKGGIDERMEVQELNPGDTLVIGDSHALSLGSPNSAVDRNDFKTLHGVLDVGLSHYLNIAMMKYANPGVDKGDLGRLVLYFGNIDVRHHICRLELTEQGRRRLIKELVQKYYDQVSILGVHTVTIVAPLPIESESRVLPKTGYFNGKPFWGSWAERDWVQQRLKEELFSAFGSTNTFDVYDHPEIYMNNRLELDFRVMEKPRSVHMSREWYPFNFATGEVNKKLKAWEKPIKELLTAGGK